MKSRNPGSDWNKGPAMGGRRGCTATKAFQDGFNDPLSGDFQRFAGNNRLRPTSALEGTREPRTKVSRAMIPSLVGFSFGILDLLSGLVRPALEKRSRTIRIFQPIFGKILEIFGLWKVGDVGAIMGRRGLDEWGGIETGRPVIAPTPSALRAEQDPAVRRCRICGSSGSGCWPPGRKRNRG